MNPKEELALRTAVRRRVLAGIEFDAAWFVIDAKSTSDETKAVVADEFKRIAKLLEAKP